MNFVNKPSKPTQFRIKWRVVETANGSSDNLKHGESQTIASGDVIKQGDEGQLRKDLTKALEDAFPKHQYGGTYELDRVYHIDMEPVNELV